MRTVAFLLSLLIASSSVAQDRALVFHTTGHDFGEVTEAEVNVTFTFANNGLVPLRIVHVQPSCGCTVPRFTDTPVEPGDTGEVVVAYHATGRAGPFRQTVQVLADADGVELSETLHVRGSVVLPWTRTGIAQGGVLFDVDQVDVGMVRLAEDMRQPFRMLWTGSRPLRLLSAKVTPEVAHVRHPRRTLYPNDVMQVEMVVPAGELERGPFEIVIHLETDDDEMPVKALHVTGQVE